MCTRVGRGLSGLNVAREDRGGNDHKRADRESPSNHSGMM
jgi:hypothetical protein